METLKDIMYSDYKIQIDGTNCVLSFKLPILLDAKTNGALDSINLQSSFNHNKDIQVNVNVFNQRYDHDEIDLNKAIGESVKMLEAFKHELTFTHNVPVKDVFITPKEIAYKFLLSGVQMLVSQNYFYAAGNLYCTGHYIAFIKARDEIYSLVFNITSHLETELDVKETKSHELEAIHNETFDFITNSIYFYFAETDE